MNDEQLEHLIETGFENLLNILDIAQDVKNSQVFFDIYQAVGIWRNHYYENKKSPKKD